MSTTLKAAGPSTHSRVSSTRSLLLALRAILTTLVNRRKARSLAEMPDYLLKDIGLRRDDIHAALERDWREDPTYQLAIAACRRRGSL